MARLVHLQGKSTLKFAVVVFVTQKALSQRFKLFNLYSVMAELEVL